MLSAEENQRLTRVGPGTPMGELMRRYWHPIAAASEFDDYATKPVRLMGEDLVLYRDRSGTYGLVDRHCPHRRADLSYGFVEDCGLRCSYHGWLFDEIGNCLHQPYEDVVSPESRFKERIHLKAYPVEEKAGLLWVYLGPQPAPLVPTWEPFTWDNGFVQIVFSEIPCNWLQCQENSIDPVHFEWLHANWSKVLQGTSGPYAATHLRLAFDEFEYGYVYRRITEDTDETNPLWTTGRVCLWPNALFTGSHFEWRVPVDDENTLSVNWAFARVPTDQEPYKQDRIPYWHSPIKDEKTGRWITSHIMNQDFVAWVGQGVNSDRTQEHLGRSDRGVTLIRKQFVRDMNSVAEGRDPKGLIRDPELNHCVELPIIGREKYKDGITREELLRHRAQNAELIPGANVDFPWQVGQPDEVRKAYAEAMGL
ncbi:MAG: Rieske 2Fe-2S domain-containing protein [Streptosporangiales bacterium]|nr:Rieske 2Fe-2S domain-containing protein [Streptosporangiales bacterium]